MQVKTHSSKFLSNYLNDYLINEIPVGKLKNRPRLGTMIIVIG